MTDSQEPSLTVEIRRTGEEEGVRIVTAGGAVAELARFLVEHYCRMLSGGAPPSEIVHQADNDLAVGSYEVEAFRASGWVPVSEGLPEPNRSVIAWGSTGWLITSLPLLPPFATRHHITHWHPLPSPPLAVETATKEEGDE